MSKWTVKRQPGSKNWGVYRDSVLVEGGFFRKSSAEDSADRYEAAERDDRVAQATGYAVGEQPS